MKQFICDICRDKITEKNKCIADCSGLIKFKVPSLDESHNRWAGFDSTLKSSHLEDICKSCVIKLIIS